MGVSVWRQRPPQAPLRERVTGWRARNWRRAILTWFVLTLAVMAVAAAPVSAPMRTNTANVMRCGRMPASRAASASEPMA